MSKSKEVVGVMGVVKGSKAKTVASVALPNVRGGVGKNEALAGSGAGHAGFSIGRTAQLDASMAALLESSKQTNKLLAALVSTSSQSTSVQLTGAQVSVNGLGDKASYFDQGSKKDAATSTAEDKRSDQQVAIDNVAAQVTRLREAYHRLRTKLTSVLPETTCMHAPSDQACESEGPDRVASHFSPTQLAMRALRADLADVIEDFNYLEEQLPT